MSDNNDTPPINVDYFEDLTGEIRTGRSSRGDKTMGDRIKRLRESKGISLEDLARATGFSRRQLAAFETGEAQPRLGAVMKLSRALDTVLGKLLSGEGEKQAAVVRRGTRVPFERTAANGRNKLYSYFSLASEVRDRHMEPLIVHLEKRAEEKLSTHDGEEFIHVLEGGVKLILDNETHELEPGDSVYYHSSLPHMITARDTHAVILAVLFE
ncbi:MAG: helix-turn-helix domain-containing protein [Desulfosudaceae bacterium]